MIPTSSGAVPILQRTSSERTPPTFSKPDELLQLWDVANGQSQDGSEEVFRLELGWYGSSFYLFSPEIETDNGTVILFALGQKPYLSRQHLKTFTPSLPPLPPSLSQGKLHLVKIFLVYTISAIMLEPI